MWVSAQDGPKLHVRDYGRRATGRLPVICLPGLTRTAADFHVLASVIASDAERPRRVLAIDYRGRGESDYDPNPDNYAIPIELGDVVSVAVACGACPAVFIGTSRGGLVTMALAAARPTFVSGAVLNDIGPVIEIDGLMRIKSHVGKLPEPRTLEEGGEILRQAFGAQFAALAPADWIAWAQRAWRLKGDRLMPTYDARLARTLEGVDPDHLIPALWAQFDALAGVPLMIVRGEISDLLSPETLQAMRARRRETTVLEVPGQGHAPLLAEADVVQRIVAFVATCDQVRA